MATIQLRPLADGAVLVRTEARRLAPRLPGSTNSDANRWRLIGDGRCHSNDLKADASGSFTDGEGFEDRELLAQLNALGYHCDKWGAEEPLVAVVRFTELSAPLGICGDCYRELSGLALGQLM